MSKYFKSDLVSQRVTSLTNNLSISSLCISGSKLRQKNFLVYFLIIRYSDCALYVQYFLKYLDIFNIYFIYVA